MKRAMTAAILAGALTGDAADTYTWSTADKTLLPDDGGAAILCEDETATVTNLTISPVNGGTVTITGDAMTFADDAAITLSTSGTVSFASQVTTLGKLSLARSDGAYIVWTGSALTETNAKTGNFSELPFADGSVAAAGLEPSSVVYVATGSECPGRFDRYVSGPSSGIFVINRVTSHHSYTIRPQIGTGGLRCITAARSQRFGYYPSTNIWDNRSIKGIDEGYWAAGTFSNSGDRLGGTSKLGLTKLFAARKGMDMPVKVRFDGGSTLGGETSVGVGVEMVLAVMEEGDNAITGTFTGDGDVRIVPMASTTYTASHYFEPWITTSWQVIATNRSLSALTALPGKMQGGSHAPGSTTGGNSCNAYHLTYDSVTDTAACQFQLKSGDNNKVVLAKLRQNGPNVEIQAIKAGRVPVATYPVGTDLTGVTLTSAGLATSTNTSGYGIHMITATFEGESKMGCVTLNGTMNAMVGNRLTFEGGERPLYVTVTSKTAFPSYGDVNVGTNADVLLHVDGLTVSGGISGGTSTLKVKRGGFLRRDDNGQITKSQQVEVDGGTFEHLGASSAISGGIYLNYLLLKDGARMTTPSGTAPRSAYDNTRSYYSVVGTEPSSIEGSGIRPYGDSTVEKGTSIAFCLNVNDVTGDEQVDCTLSKFDAAPSSYAYSNFENGATVRSSWKGPGSRFDLRRGSMAVRSSWGRATA